MPRRIPRRAPPRDERTIRRDAVRVDLRRAPAGYCADGDQNRAGAGGEGGRERARGAALAGGAPGEADPEGIAAVTAQLIGAADALRALAGDSAAVVRLWASFVQNPSPGFPAPPSPPIAATPVHPAQRLRVRADGQVYARTADQGTALRVAVGTSGAVEVAGKAMRFVQRILEAKELVAGDCVGWSDDGAPFAWSDVEVVLTNLKRDGLLEDVGAAR
jgi:hypothetical protein